MYINIGNKINISDDFEIIVREVNYFEEITYSHPGDSPQSDYTKETSYTKALEKVLNELKDSGCEQVIITNESAQVTSIHQKGRIQPIPMFLKSATIVGYFLEQNERPKKEEKEISIKNPTPPLPTYPLQENKKSLIIP